MPMSSKKKHKTHVAQESDDSDWEDLSESSDSDKIPFAVGHKRTHKISRALHNSGGDKTKA